MSLEQLLRTHVPPIDFVIPEGSVEDTYYHHRLKKKFGHLLVDLTNPFSSWREFYAYLKWYTQNHCGIICLYPDSNNDEDLTTAYGNLPVEEKSQYKNWILAVVPEHTFDFNSTAGLFEPILNIAGIIEDDTVITRDHPAYNKFRLLSKFSPLYWRFNKHLHYPIHWYLRFPFDPREVGLTFTPDHIRVYQNFNYVLFTHAGMLFAVWGFYDVNVLNNLIWVGIIGPDVNLEPPTSTMMKYFLQTYPLLRHEHIFAYCPTGST